MTIDQLAGQIHLDGIDVLARLDPMDGLDAVTGAADDDQDGGPRDALHPMIDGSMDRLIDLADRPVIPAADLERHVWTGPRVIPLGPEAVATAWMSALLVRRDWTTLWSLTDANVRLASAQQWLAGLGSTGDNVTAWSLAAEVPHLGMWASFAAQLFAEWLADLTLDRTGGDRCVPRVTDRHQFRKVGASDAGRELCVVSLGSRGVDGPDGATRHHLTLRLRDRWRVAGIGGGVLQPGWPTRWLPLDVDRPGRGS